MLEHIIYLLMTKKAFVRARVPMEVRALGILLVYLGLSYRKTQLVLSMLYNVSYEAIRKWYHKASGIFDLTIEKKHRTAIAIDETMVKIGDEWYYLWAAIDIETWEILGVYLSRGRSHLDTLMFLKKVLKYCENKPYVYVDGGPWYPWALDRLGLEWEHKTFGKRNPIEEWFSILKRRIKVFYKKWGKRTAIKTVETWCLAFVAMYNLILQIRREVSYVDSLNSVMPIV